MASISKFWSKFRQSGRRRPTGASYRREQLTMSHSGRKKIGIERMQPILVDAEGKVWSATPPVFWMRPQRAEGNIVDYAVATLGFVHIWPIDGSSIVVSLRPDLVRPKTMAAAFYAMADLRPVRVFISATTTTKPRWELFDRLDRALNRIDRLVTAARRSSIGTQLLRVQENLAANDNVPPRRASTLIHRCDVTRWRGDREEVVPQPARLDADSAMTRQGSHVGERSCRGFLDSP